MLLPRIRRKARNKSRKLRSQDEKIARSSTHSRLKQRSLQKHHREPEEHWDLVYVFTTEEIQDPNAAICEEDSCQEKACSIWESNRSIIYSCCLGCQQHYFGDWPKDKEPKADHYICIKEWCESGDESEDESLASAGMDESQCSKERMLQYYCESQDFAEAMKRVKIYPEEAGHSDDRFGCLPLHIIVGFPSVPLPLLKQVYVSKFAYFLILFFKFDRII